MAKKSAPSREVEPFQVRWTNEDNEANLPERFKKALRICSVERAPLTRTLIRKWVQEIEERACDDPAIAATMRKTVEKYPPQARQKVNYALNETPPPSAARKPPRKK